MRSARTRRSCRVLRLAKRFLLWTMSRRCVCWWDTLGDLGYQAIEAVDAASGLKVLESDVKIDLLITNLGPPDGMNGKQMADKARMRRPNLKILFITGYAKNAAVANGHLEPRCTS